ncbi:Golgi integral membrane protein 4 [Arapaima gigas]
MIAGVTSLRQKKVIQVLLLLLFAFGTLYAAKMMYEMHEQLKKYKALVLQYRQPQEALGARGEGNVNDLLERNQQFKNTDLSMQLQNHRAAAVKEIENLQNQEQHKWLELRREAMLQQVQEEGGLFCYRGQIFSEFS